MLPWGVADPVSLPTRVAIVEEQIKPLQEFRTWALGLLAGGLLAFLAGAAAWGSLNTKVDRMAEDVAEIRQDVREALHSTASR